MKQQATTNRHTAPSPLRRWANLALGVFCIWLFVFVIGPQVRRIGPVDRFCAFTEERGIDPTALFYTDSEIFGDVDVSVRSAMNY